MLGIVSTGLLAQSLEPFNPYSSVSPSAETYSMTKYGGLTPSLYSGAMTYSVPVFTCLDTVEAVIQVLEQTTMNVSTIDAE